MPIAASIFYGATPFVTDGPRVSKSGGGGLDSVSLEILTGANWESEAGGMGYVANSQIPGYASMWVESIENDPQSDLCHLVSVRGAGLATSGERRFRTISVGSQQVAVGDYEKVVLVWEKKNNGEQSETGDYYGSTVLRIKRRVTKVQETGADQGEPEYQPISTPSGIFDRWNIGEAILSVSDQYYSTSVPSTSAVNQPSTPPSAPGTPSYEWGGYDKPMRAQHPNGWVLVDRQPRLLYGTITTGLWQVTDTWEYRQTAIPD